MRCSTAAPRPAVDDARQRDGGWLSGRLRDSRTARVLAADDAGTWRLCPLTPAIDL